MRQQDFDRFDALMQGIAENYGQTVTAQGIALRFRMLKQFEIDEIEKAAMSLLAQRKFTTMPTVADFLEHLGGGSAEDKAEAAAGKAVRAVAEVGSYASVTFDDAVLMAVIENAWGGWPEFCAACVGQEVKFVRRELAKAYAAYARQGVRRYGHLSGITENSNGSAGYLEHIPAPRLVGNREDAARVLEAGETQSALATAGTAGLQAAMNRELPYDVDIVQ